MDVAKIFKKEWDKATAEVGRPIEGKDRERIIEILGGEPEEDDPEYVESYVLALQNLVEAYRIFKRIEKGGIDKDSTMASQKIGVKAAQIAAQRLQRRVDIAQFILFATYTPYELFTPLVRHEPLPKKRINWKKMVMEWNQTHPSDTMTSTDVFRTTFYKILREKKVRAELFIRAFSEAFRYLAMPDKNIEFTKNLMALYGIKYEVKKRGKAE